LRKVSVVRQKRRPRLRKLSSQSAHAFALPTEPARGDGIALAGVPGYRHVLAANSAGETIQLEPTMLSARNQLPAKITSVKLGNVMAEVVMTVGGVELVSAITRGSAEQLGLKAGDSVKAVIKSTEVMIDKS
jgi:molybdopterin-binding protein